MEIRRTYDILENIKLNHNKSDNLAAKQDGQWIKFSGDDYYLYAKKFAYGLLEMGFNKGDKIATISNNRPEWNFVDMGMAMVGVIHVPIYPNIGDADYQHILAHSDARIVIVSDKSLYDRLSVIAKEISFIEKVYTFNFYENVPHWAEIAYTGENVRVKHKEKFKEICDSISPDDVVSIIYTSGTTGVAKGVMLTHSNFISNVKSCLVFPLTPEDRILSFLPLCHVFERMVNYLFQYYGCSIYYAENLGTISQDIQDVKVSAFVSVPRVLEKIHEKIISKGNELRGFKKWVFTKSLELGENYANNGKNSIWYNIRLKFFRILVFSKWKKALGGKLKFIVSGGAALQPRLSRLFFAAGIPLQEGYGLTETSPVIAVNHLKTPNNLMIGTVGPLADKVEVKIDDDGEILVKGPNVMKGYYKDDAATEASIDTQGWFHTGDIGAMVDGKFLKITDRKKEIFKTSAGKYVAPQSIENKMRESRFIEQVMIVGENEKFVSAIISPNFEYLHEWAHEKFIRFQDNMQLIELPEVYKQYQKEIDYFNSLMGNFEHVLRFRLVPDSWNVNTGELSPTLKLRRKHLYNKYEYILKEIYGYKI
ncbi:MAG: AMP-dependent synthetase/ligase [Marinilabiliaceae bacterium]|nr:AMP-dependent synthetase/ligase [Marinilabiliaceae bacterium]